jgi:hypothetical protein
LKLSGTDQLVSYRGHISGDPEAKTILSFAQQCTGGFISTSSENFIIETLSDQKNMQMIYKENEANTTQAIPCGVNESEIPDPIKKIMSDLNLKSISTLKLITNSVNYFREM